VTNQLMPDFPPELQVFAQHRTIRFFKQEPLESGHLDLIIEAGRRAPTDAQGHMYSVIRITNMDLRDRLAVLCGSQQQIRDTAEFFVFCLDVYRLRKLIEHRGGEWGMEARIALLYGTSDATMVAQNMMIAAEELDYGTCYIGAVQNNVDKVARELALPPGVLPLYGLCVGVIDGEQLPELRPRIPRELCFFENEYNADFSEDELESGYEAMSVKRDWYESISRYFATDGTMEVREPIMARAWEQQHLTPRVIE
jgi:FMN reductase (NADPH)